MVELRFGRSERRLLYDLVFALVWLFVLVTVAVLGFLGVFMP